MHTKYQPTVFNIKGPCCRVQCFCCIENSVHLEDFQHRGRRWAYHQGMTSVMRLHTIFFSSVMVYFVGHAIRPPRVSHNIADAHYMHTICSTSKVHVVRCNVFVGLKIMWIWKTSNIGNKGGYITKAWQEWLGLHTIYFHDVVYYRPHYKVAQGMLHSISTPTIYHNQCREVSKSQANSRG